MSYSKYVDPYIDMILKNKVVHCREQEQMINNIIIPVLKRDDVYIDEEKIEAGLALQKYFPYRLVEWEVFLFALIAGVFFKSGEIFFTDIRILVGRGSGKNGFVSFLCFYFLSPVHGIEGYNIDLLANSEKQVQTSFRDVFEVIKNPHDKKNEGALKANFGTPTKESIFCKATKSEMRFNTSSKRGKDSKRTGAVIFDEKHEYLTTDNINTLSSGLGKVPDGREITITTDGHVRGGVLDKEKEQNRAILERYDPDNRTLVFWCRIEDKEEWNDLGALVKAIPSLNDFGPLRTRLQAEIKKMPHTPEYYYEYMAKRCNFPVQSGAAAVASDENLNAASEQELIDLTGRDCVGGVDYSTTDDFTACVLLFRDGEKYYLLQHTFVCVNSRDLRGIKAPLKEWAAQGELEFVDSPDIGADIVANWFRKMGEKYNIRRIAIDDYRKGFVKHEFAKIGYKHEKDGRLYVLRRGDNMKVFPLMNSMFVNKNIVWGHAPYSIMNWYTNNVMVMNNGTSFYYGKQEPNLRKTDGFFAWIAAMSIAEDLEAQETGILLDLPVITI